MGGVFLMSGTWADHGSYPPHVCAEAAGGAAWRLRGCLSIMFFDAAFMDLF